MLRALESLPEAWLDRDLTFQLCSQVLNSSQSHSHSAIFSRSPVLNSQVLNFFVVQHQHSAVFNTSTYFHCYHPKVLNSSQSHSHSAIFNSKPCSQISSSQFLFHSASAVFNTSPYSHCFHPKVLSTKQFLISFS